MRQIRHRPLPTGSDTHVKTAGIERVAFSVADTTELVETKITSGASATISSATLRMRSALSPVNR
jgi:hypothetical protein